MFALNAALMGSARFQPEVHRPRPEIQPLWLNGLRPWCWEQCLLSLWTTYVYLVLLVNMHVFTVTAAKTHRWSAGYFCSWTQNA